MGEIVDLAHFLLYPAILALKICRAFCFVIGMVLLCLVMEAYEHAGWIVGIGPNSLEYRQQFVTEADDYPEDVTMDFSAYPVMSEERKALFAQYPGSSFYPSLTEPVAATRLTGKAAPELRRGDSENDFTRMPGTGSGAWEPGISGWKYRSLDSIYGKSARMNMAIVRGQIMKSELRRSIAMIKYREDDVLPDLTGWGSVAGTFPSLRPPVTEVQRYHPNVPSARLLPLEPSTCKCAASSQSMTHSALQGAGALVRLVNQLLAARAVTKGLSRRPDRRRMH